MVVPFAAPHGSGKGTTGRTPSSRGEEKRKAASRGDCHPGQRRTGARSTFLSSSPDPVVADRNRAGISTWTWKPFALRANNLQRLPWHRRASPSATLDKSLGQTSIASADAGPASTAFLAMAEFAVPRASVAPLAFRFEDRRIDGRRGQGQVFRVAPAVAAFHDRAALAETQRTLAGGESLERRQQRPARRPHSAPSPSPRPDGPRWPWSPPCRAFLDAPATTTPPRRCRVRSRSARRTARRPRWQPRRCGCR